MEGRENVAGEEEDTGKKENEEEEEVNFGAPDFGFEDKLLLAAAAVVRDDEDDEVEYEDEDEKEAALTGFILISFDRPLAAALALALGCEGA